MLVNADWAVYESVPVATMLVGALEVDNEVIAGSVEVATIATGVAVLETEVSVEDALDITSEVASARTEIDELSEVEVEASEALCVMLVSEAVDDSVADAETFVVPLIFAESDNGSEVESEATRPEPPLGAENPVN